MQRSGGSAREGVYVLRGLLLCGLVMTAGTGGSALHASFRGALPLLAGLVFGTALAEVESAGHTISFRWTLHLGAMWLATLSRDMWGNREVLRTCAVAGGLAILIRRGTGARLLAWVAVAIVVALASSRVSWLQGSASELQYALGGAWPRGWGDVARDSALFLFGCRTAGGRGILVVARWGGIADPLRALGSMPLTTGAVQYVFAAALIGVGHSGAHPAWFRPALIDGLLIVQLVFAERWLRDRERGPCEHALYMVHTTYVSLRLAASSGSRRPVIVVAPPH